MEEYAHKDLDEKLDKLQKRMTRDAAFLRKKAFVLFTKLRI